MILKGQLEVTGRLMSSSPFFGQVWTRSRDELHTDHIPPPSRPTPGPLASLHGGHLGKSPRAQGRTGCGRHTHGLQMSPTPHYLHELSVCFPLEQVRKKVDKRGKGRVGGRPRGERQNLKRRRHSLDTPRVVGSCGKPGVRREVLPPFGPPHGPAADTSIFDFWFPEP